MYLLLQEKNQPRRNKQNSRQCSQFRKTVKVCQAKLSCLYSWILLVWQNDVWQITFIYISLGFFDLLRWLSGKGSTCQSRRYGFETWVGKIPWMQKWQPTPVFLSGKAYGQRSLAGFSLWGCKESDMTEHAHTTLYLGISRTAVWGHQPWEFQTGRVETLQEKVQPKFADVCLFASNCISNQKMPLAGPPVQAREGSIP